MNIPYIIQVQLCIALFWLVYRLFMRRSGAFGHNRAYLLGAMAVAFVIPALSIPVWPAQAPQVQTGLFEIGDLEAYIVREAAPATLDWTEILTAVYAIGVLVMSAGVVWHVGRMLRSLRRSKVVKMGVLKIVSHETVRSPYSFFNYIFVRPEPAGGEGLPEIVAHEMAHARYRHSVDSVFAQILLILLWWNPFVWLWNRSLKELHEYQADRAVLNQGFDSKQYITLLIGTLADLHPEFVSSFSYSLLKNRLLMITKQTGRRSKRRTLAAIPAAAALMLLFSFTEKAPAETTLPEIAPAVEQAPPAPVPEIFLPETVPAVEVPEEPSVIVEDMPKFDGKKAMHFLRWAMEQIRYPEAAYRNKIEGRVMVSFVVEKDGSVTFDKVLSSPDVSLNGEVERVILLSPRWTPGSQQGQNVRVKFTMPIDFKLSGNTPAPALEAEAKPTILVDGKLFVQGMEGINSIDPQIIRSIDVFKTDPAYPDGVIRITLKDGMQVGDGLPAPHEGIKVVGYRTAKLDSLPRTAGEVVVVGYGTRRKSGEDGGVRFRLRESKGAEGSKGNPLIILDGIKMPADFNIDVINYGKIKSITILKDASAIEQYGEEAKDGVLVITTKKQEQ